MSKSNLRCSVRTKPSMVQPPLVAEHLHPFHVLLNGSPGIVRGNGVGCAGPGTWGVMSLHDLVGAATVSAGLVGNGCSFAERFNTVSGAGNNNSVWGGIRQLADRQRLPAQPHRFSSPSLGARIGRNGPAGGDAMQRTRIKDILERESAGGEVLVQGMGQDPPLLRRSFLHPDQRRLNPHRPASRGGTVARPTMPWWKTLNTGCSVCATGELVESEGRNQKYEIKASRLEVLGQADPEEYPLQKKRHTLEFPAGNRPPAPPHQHLRRHGPGPQHHGPTPSTVSSSSGASSTSRRP